MIHLKLRVREVNKRDAEEFGKADDELAQLQHERDVLEADIIRRLEEGQPIEPGPRSAEIVETIENGVRRKRLKIR